MGDLLAVRAGEVRLAYRAWGPEGAPALLLLHALGESGASWDAVAPAFAERFRVYAPDLRGHGDSDWPGTYSFALMLGDVLAFLDALGVGRAGVIGHSMGGAVAYLLAGEHPGRVNRLVIEDAVPPYPRPYEEMERPEGSLPFDWPVVSAIRRQVGRPDPAWGGLLERIAAPTLMVGGGVASHIPQELIEATARRIPRCELITIPAGHMVHDARPEEFTAAALAFLTP